MLAPSLSRGSFSFDETHTLAHWINRHHRKDGEREYAASLTAAPGTGLPTLVVEMHDRTGLVATYKCGIGRVASPPSASLVLAPLVVIWNGARPSDSATKGREMIDHLIGAVQGLRAASMGRGERVMIASGNLTKAKGGRRFSRAWDGKSSTPAHEWLAASI